MNDFTSVKSASHFRRMHAETQLFANLLTSSLAVEVPSLTMSASQAKSTETRHRLFISEKVAEDSLPLSASSVVPLVNTEIRF